MPKFNFNDIVTDSRKITEGSLFIALKGEIFNGEDFAVEAVNKGAAGVIVSTDCPKEKLPENGLVLKVSDTLAAYQSFARAWRDNFNIPIVAITGSNGKTTTKDLTAAALSRLGDIQKTSKNYNNEIGVPLTLLGLNESHKAAVVEVGMRGLHQIDALAEVVKPTIGIVINVTETHIELLGSIENIALAKSEMVTSIKRGGLVILNADDPNVLAMKDKAAEGVKVLTFGIDHEADLQAFDIETDSITTTFKVRGIADYTFKISLLGRHNVLNALAAICAALESGLSCEDIQAGFEELETTAMRFQVIEKDGLTIINDAYNAAPASMRASLKTTADLAKGRKIAVLGDMLELGDISESAHREVGRETAKVGFDFLITLGTLAKFIAAGAEDAGLDAERVLSFETHEDAAEALKGIIKTGDTVLFKASRGMKLEKVLELI
ncbi:MAG: UDP-N-acetylmuramoyl-tripeptide--D-alanyl-D-alanine ligase [Selenomonadaceae bacterium]|nr:UDP-N-acetylmuramoyl-tripeptide--D-alanyl-D-alanine ligase [Selenomonadaceae bacterium]